MTYWFVTERTKDARLYRFNRKIGSYNSSLELSQTNLFPDEKFLKIDLAKPQADNLACLAPTACILFAKIGEMFEKLENDDTKPDPTELEWNFYLCNLAITEIYRDRSIRGLHYTLPTDIVRHLTKSARGISLKARYLKEILNCYTPQADLINFTRLKEQFELLKHS